MQNQPMSAVENISLQNKNTFSQEELLMIKDIFLHRHRFWLYKDEVIYRYYTRTVFLNLRRKTVRLNQMKEEVELKKLPLTKSIITKLNEDIKVVITEKKHNKKLQGNNDGQSL